MDERSAKKAREAERLRDVGPEESIRRLFSLMRFTRRLSEAANRG